MSDDLTDGFWRFSLALYKQPGIADECLDLQERLGIDVNLLLFRAYAGTHETAFDDADIAAAFELTREWHEKVVRSLRSARNALKPWSLNAELHFSPLAAQLRAQVQRNELEAERVEHAILAHWLLSNSENLRRAVRNNAIDQNIRLLLKHHGGSDESGNLPMQLIAAALRQA